MLLFVLLLTTPIPSRSANILGVVPSASYSHQIVYRPLWRELSLRGHNVTIITPNPMNNSTLTNLTEIDVSGMYEIWEKEFTKMVTQFNPFTMINDIMAFIHKLETAFMEEDEVQTRIIKSERKFDLIIAEILIFVSFGFAKNSLCPIILLSPLDMVTYFHNLAGNPVHPGLYSDFSLPLPRDKSFVERVVNTLYTVSFDRALKKTLFPLEEVALRRYFGDGGATFEELQEKVSVLLLNMNPVYTEVRPISPSTILIGEGIHMKMNEPKELPKDIKDFLDKAEIIYFSLGTNVKAKDLTPEMLQAFLDTFQKLPYQILWKYDKELLAIPPNVKVLKWIPQADVLRHKNVKLFITQGGLQSMEEAIFFHVPLVGMPFYLDQETNVRTIVEKKIGLRILPKELDVPTFTKTILEVISNPTYKKNMEKLAKLALDQPMSGLEKAVWWTEYVLRHKGAKHLRRPLSEQLPMYQYLLLDVLAFVLGVLFTIVFILYKIYRFFRPKKIVRFFDDKKIN